MAVDHQRAGAADALTAVAVESDAALLLLPQSLVELVEHLQEGGFRIDAGDLELLEGSVLAGLELPPDLELEIHL